MTDERIEAFEKLLGIVDRLRAENGCPWDRKQTLSSMIPHLLEETHEVVDALVRDKRDAVREELGDLLMNILLCARIAQDAGSFSLAEISAEIADKLVRRHPHVFGDTQVDSVDGVLKNWEAIKQAERGGSKVASALEGVPASLPALSRAARFVDKAASTGFVWPDPEAAARKLDEEIGELKEALAGDSAERRQEEIGDVLFATVALARKLKIDPEVAMRNAANRFETRFRTLEQSLGKPLADAALAEMLNGWERAKATLADSDARFDRLPAEWRVIVRRMDSARRALLRAGRDLPPDRFVRKPREEAGTWSVRDVLEHLLDVDQRLVALFRRFAEQGRQAGESGVFPSTGVLSAPARSMVPPQGKIVGPPHEQRPDLATQAALERALAAARADLLDAVIAVAEFDPRALKGPHPVFGELDALQWGDFIPMHERRHAAQITKILEHLDPA